MKNWGATGRRRGYEPRDFVDTSPFESWEDRESTVREIERAAGGRGRPPTAIARPLGARKGFLKYRRIAVGEPNKPERAAGAEGCEHPEEARALSSDETYTYCRQCGVVLCLAGDS